MRRIARVGVQQYRSVQRNNLSTIQLARASTNSNSHMQPFTVRVMSEGSSKTVVQNPTGSHELVLDEPKSVHGGTDQGMSPLQACLGSLVACEISEARLVLKDMDLNVNAMRVKKCTGWIDDRSYRSGKGPLGFTKVQATYEIESDNATEEQIKKLQQKVEAQCPIYGMFSKAGCEMDISWTLKK